MSHSITSPSSFIGFDDIDLSGIDDFSIDVVDTSAHAQFGVGAASCAGCGVGCSCSCSCSSCGGCSCKENDELTGNG
jgi:hypothetical protein